MFFRIRPLTIAPIAIAALGLASVVASGQSGEKAKEKVKPTQHCVENLSKPDAAPVCYDTFTAAIAAATGGQISDAPADPGTAMKDQRLLERLNVTKSDKKSYKKSDEKRTDGVEQVAATDVLIGIIYWQSDFGAPSKVYTARGGCDIPLNPVEWQVAYVGDNWNDNSESFKAFSGCFMRLWEHRDFGGRAADWAEERHDFGSMNNEVSSLEWS